MIIMLSSPFDLYQATQYIKHTITAFIKSIFFIIWFLICAILSVLFLSTLNDVYNWKHFDDNLDSILLDLIQIHL